MRLKQLLGEIMIGMGFVTRQQVDEALQRQRKIFEEKTVPERLKRARLVSQARLAIDRFPLLGKILTDMGFATKEQLEEALKEQSKMVEVYKSLESEKLGTTIEIGFIVNSTLDLAQVLALIMGYANRVTNSIASTLMLLDDKTGELVFSVPTGPKGDRLTDIRLPSGKGIAGWVAEHEEPALVPDAREDPRFYPEIDKISGFETKSILCVPLKAKTKLIGVLEAINKADGTSFTEEDTLLLNIFAYQAAMAIENARLYGELKDRLEEQILMQKKLAENITDLKHAEDALKASQEYTRNIIDSSLDMIIAVDMNRRVVEFNKAAERTFGYRREDVAGTIVDILYADPNEGLEVHKTAMDKGQCMREILNRRKNGEVFPSFLSASTLLDTHGDVQGVMGVSRDITARKRAEEALRESEEKYRSLFEESKDAVYISTREGTFIVANQSALELFGYSREEMTSMNALQLYVHPSDAGKFQKEIEEKGFVRDYEVKLVKKDGTEMDCLFNVSVRRASDGSIYVYQGIIRDITARKLAEEALKRSEERYRALFENNPIETITADLEGRVTGFNSAKRKAAKKRPGGRLPNIGDRMYTEDYAGKHTIDMRAELTDCLKSGESKEFPELEYNGVVWHTNIAPFPEGAIITSMDITARKQAQDKLTASLKEKEVLLKEIHHRVKNNMQVISSMLSLQSQHITDKASRAMFQESQDRIRSMALIHEKLYQSDDMAQIDIASYIQDLTASLFSTYTVSNAIKVTIAITDIFLTITTAIPCGLIINELVTNALKHAFPHQREGTITVSMTPSTNNHLILTVSDTGIGFPKGIDFRNTTTLGMQLVTSLVEQLEGTITLDRRKGTTFTITFRGGGTV